VQTCTVAGQTNQNPMQSAKDTDAPTPLNAPVFGYVRRGVWRSRGQVCGAFNCGKLEPTVLSRTGNDRGMAGTTHIKGHNICCSYNDYQTGHRGSKEKERETTQSKNIRIDK
jgi:hypothetical protein